MKKTILQGVIGLVFLILLMIMAKSQYAPQQQVVVGKAPAAVLSGEVTEAQQTAQDIALSDPRVQEYTYGHPSEVFGVSEVGLSYPATARACLTADCRQVNIYNWDENAAITVIVDMDSGEVLEVLHQVGVHPDINRRLLDLAVEISLDDPQVIEILGYSPSREDIDMLPVPADAPGSVCEGDRLCVAPVFKMGDQILWVIVDLHAEGVAAIRWTETGEEEEGAISFPATGGCPTPGAVSRDGWALSHDVTGTDGLGVYDISYKGHLVATSIKLMEWHADYGSSGFRDSTGCGGGGGGFPIYPYGETQIVDLETGVGEAVGFEIVQDFRMSSWGESCNYRYEQHIQFFNDGRFRVVSGAYGKGCGVNAIYRPVVRIDIAVDGDPGDSFAIYDSRGEWTNKAKELWRTPDAGEDGPHYYTSEGYAWKVTDSSGAGYYIEPGQGQFDDGGRGDNPYIYVTQHDPAQGDADMGVFGACCNDSYVQGPEQFVNNQSIENENIVFWYVPQMITDAVEGSDGYYCWTLQTDGVPGPTYPCFSGPMFVPIENESEIFIPFLENTSS